MEYATGIQNFIVGGVPSYIQTYHDVKWGVEYCYTNCTGDFYPQTFYDTLKTFAVFDNIGYDVCVLLGLAFLWTILRYILATMVFKVMCYIRLLIL